jgi:LysM repeat protein
MQAAFPVSANSSGGNLLGSPATPARNRRLARRLPAVAAPVLCGAAAAFAVAATPATSMAATTQAQGHHAAVTVQRPAANARLMSVTRPAANAAAVSYTVKSGDTLSAIAQRYYSDPSYWTTLFAANHGEIANANDIQVGQVLSVPAKPANAPAAPTSLSAAPVSAPVQQSAPQEQTASLQSATVQQSTVSTTGDSSFQQCVISRESGGNPQVMNSSGHYGLYQFSASTWAAYGGNPADFGHASVAEQNQVFNNAIAAGGQSNWAPYDGC